MSAGRIATHPDPAWRQRSNFLIRANIETPETDLVAEQLWTRQLGTNEFELCCIPFFIYDIALGDVVRADAEHNLTHLIRRSGRYAYRVFLRDPEATMTSLRETLDSLGALVEHYSASLIAVDAGDLAHAEAVVDLLQSLEDAGSIVYEAARTK